MAYVNLLNQNCTDKADAFCHVRDFIGKRNGTYDYSTTGIGWTLIDSSYAVDEDNPQVNDWVVFHSTGESGDEDLYFRFRWSSTDFDFNGMLYWNTTTHVGSVYYASTANTLEFNNTETNVPLWLYGDLDSVICLFQQSAGAYFGFHGRLEKPYTTTDGTISNCTSGALTAGSDKSITVDSVPPNWAVGWSFYIWSSDATTTNVEKTTIKTLVGNTITCDLTKPYAAGSKLSDHCGYSGDNTAANNIGAYNSLINAYGTSGVINYVIYPVNASANNIIDWVNPDPLNSEYGMVPFRLGQTLRGHIGAVKNVLLCNSTGITNADVLALSDGTEYRVFQTAALGFCFREV